MLKGIPAILPPELLKVLCEMGHGDEIVIADGNFPAASNAKKLIRMDGHGIPEILDAVLQLFPLDTYVDYPVMLMEETGTEPHTWEQYRKIIATHGGDPKAITQIERFAYYDRAQTAYAIIASGEPSFKANIILKKGVITADPST